MDCGDGAAVGVTVTVCPGNPSWDGRVCLCNAWMDFPRGRTSSMSTTGWIFPRWGIRTAAHWSTTHAVARAPEILFH